jgi:predicted nucleic acid-binding protein
MEVLAGARNREERDSLRRLLRRCELVPVEPADYEAAAGLSRACRHHGETVRNLVDCLIAAVALRAGVALLHADADFDAIARTTPLKVA